MSYGLRAKSPKNNKEDKKSQFLNFSTSQLLILSLLVFHFSLLTSNFSLTYAANPKKDLSEIERKLKESKKQVKEAIEQEKSILSEIDRINKSIKKKQGEIKTYEIRISQTESDMKNLENELMTLTGRLEQNKEKLKGRLKALYKQHYGVKALILISAKDYQDLISKSRYMNLIAYYDRQIINAVNSEISIANEKKTDLELLRKNLQISKENVQNKQKEMNDEISKKDNLLASVRSKRSSYEDMIKELEESSEKLRAMIEAFDKEKPSEQVPGTGFGAQKGRLPWPINGDVIIPYGKYSDPQYNIPVFKNGIEIRAVNSEQPRAVAGGNVVYADWFKGYGLLLIINHGNGYHSLYGHLSEIFFKSGDIIKKGIAVGNIGESGVLNTPSLYFEIRYRGKPMDPMQWLKKTNNKHN
jgi:septal ring factor EnvC (AmiA/AmiB activator)